MRNSAQVTFAMLGILMMVVGITTTYIALGQDAESTDETQESPVVTMATLTPLPQLTSVPSVEIQELAAPEINDSPPASALSDEQQNPTSVPPTLMPSLTIITPVVAVASPTLALEATTIPAQAIEPTTQVELVVSTPTMVITVTEAVPTAIVEPTLSAESTEIVMPESTLEQPVTESVEMQQEPTQIVLPAVTINPKETMSTGSASSGISAVTPGGITVTAQQTPTNEVEGIAVTLAAPIAIPELVTELPTLELTVFTETSNVIIITEQPVEALQTVTPTLEISPEPGVLPSVILGQVDSPIAVNMILLLPSGETMNQMVDEQGFYNFEVFESGDYRLEAVAPGYLSREKSFTLSVGEALELPLTLLDSRDPNQDNRIDLDDIVLVAANFDGPALVVEADVNDDAWIDISDLTIIASRLGLTGPLSWNVS